MRDLDRWKDKVELQLDGRQIFFLFFGSAIGACMIFVLGVVVGKRVEARNAAHQQGQIADPLAALDELGSTEEGLTFHSTLTEKKPPPQVHKDPAPEPRPEVPPSRVEPAQELKPAPKADAKLAKDSKADAKDKDKDKDKGRFTLQLSAFATKSEAVDFIRRLRDSGYKPFMIESQIPGKGLMYRVRLGDFGTRESALTAKSEFERKQKMVAYVAKL